MIILCDYSVLLFQDDRMEQYLLFLIGLITNVGDYLTLRFLLYIRNHQPLILRHHTDKININLL